MCLNFFLIKIGCDNTNSIKVDTSVVVDVMNTAVEIAKTEGNNQIFTINEIFINNGPTGRIICSNFSIGNFSTQNTLINNTFTTQQVSNIQTNIANQVQDDLTQQQTAGILAFLNSLGQAGNVTNSQDITNKVKESVTNAVKQIDINEIWNSDVTQNIITIDNEGLIEGDQQCEIANKSASRRLEKLWKSSWPNSKQANY